MSNNHEASTWHSTDWQPPNWWCSEEQQLKRARQKFGRSISLPEPSEWAPRSSTEVPLLHIPAPCRSLWSTVGGVWPPFGFHADFSRLKNQTPSFDNLYSFLYYLNRFRPNRTATEWRRESQHENYLSTSIDLDDDPDMEYCGATYDGPTWVAFDPGHYGNSTAESPETEHDYAGSEVFSALMQFPKWPYAWRGDATVYLRAYAYYSHSHELGYPYGPGMRRKYDYVPCLERRDEMAQLVLSYEKMRYSSSTFLQPRVRKY